MNIFGFRPFKGRFNLGNSDDIPTNTDGTLIGAVKKINSNLGEKIPFPDYANMSAIASVVASGTSVQPVYTATTDCYFNIIDFYMSSAGGTAYLYINNSLVMSIAFSSFRETKLFPLKAGDIVTIQNSASVTAGTVVYTIIPMRN